MKLFLDFGFVPVSKLSLSSGEASPVRPGWCDWNPAFPDNPVVISRAVSRSDLGAVPGAPHTRTLVFSLSVS